MPKIVVVEHRHYFFFFIERGYFDQKLPKESEKNGLDALQQQFLA